MTTERKSVWKRLDKHLPIGMVLENRKAIGKMDMMVSKSMVEGLKTFFASSPNLAMECPVTTVVLVKQSKRIKDFLHLWLEAGILGRAVWMRQLPGFFPDFSPIQRMWIRKAYYRFATLK